MRWRIARPHPTWTCKYKPVFIDQMSANEWCGTKGDRPFPGSVRLLRMRGVRRDHKVGSKPLQGCAQDLLERSSVMQMVVTCLTYNTELFIVARQCFVECLTLAQGGNGIVLRQHDQAGASNLRGDLYGFVAPPGSQCCKLEVALRGGMQVR